MTRDESESADLLRRVRAGDEDPGPSCCSDAAIGCGGWCACGAARDDYDRAVRWVETRGAKLSETWRRELADFRVEAEMLLKPPPNHFH